MERLQQLEPAGYQWLGAEDLCWHYGDYTSGGGYQASDTNHWISNLKKKPSAPAGELYWKSQAVTYWGNLLRSLLPPDRTQNLITFVPVPGSKPRGHVDYDERMLRVLRHMALGYPNLDVRPLLVQTREREPQHHGSRLSPTELLQTLAVDQGQLGSPLKKVVFVVDDVITQGSSFNAAKSLITPLSGVEQVRGLFLAKTVWPQPDPSVFAGLLAKLRAEK